jgi:23S rRNA (guanine2445-N2)-methyltransferase / 23S rRNA (guanine2069-N7)-methyltransferase
VTKQRVELFNLSTSCAAGLEGLVAEEIRRFGGQYTVIGTGVVLWRGPLDAGYKSCLWSRFASRVFLELENFVVVDEESLYQAALNIDWLNHLTERSTFAISCTLSGKTPLSHSRFAALKFKDGLVDSLRNRTGTRPSVKTSRPDVQFHLHLENERAVLSLDLSGESLHRRGYRALSGRAPLKETLAAAIVALSGWGEKPQPLVDPMCGTATLLIEAAQMLGNSAPGLSRNYFGFLGWLGHDPVLWQAILDEALAQELAAETRVHPLIIGFDCDPHMVAAARKNIARAGLDGIISVMQKEVARIEPPPGKPGMLLSNLPYGERLSEKRTIHHLYRGYGNILRSRFPGWRVGVFVADPQATESFGLVWQNKYKLFNGALPCRLLLGSIDTVAAAKFTWPQREAGPGGDGEFANRFRKNLKQRLRWAERENISCFRVYDRDLPDYNLSIDLYGKWVHIQEWSPPKNIDQKLAEDRLSRAVIAVKEILHVRSDRVFLKTRERQRGRAQYEKQGDHGKMYEVQEGPCTFLVNFTDYLDTGLFLDHRSVRAKIFTASAGKNFLNLFGYTGTASVHAALGGAKLTTTVDLSATYLEWTRMNLARNGLGEITNKTEQADCQEWLRECTATYDLILLDPPTFSNTKKDKRVFDIQEDHSRLLELTMGRLAPEGLLIFSTNFRKFQLAPELTKLYAVTDISAASVPLDFARDAKVHRCWEFRHKYRW